MHPAGRHPRPAARRTAGRQGATLVELLAAATIVALLAAAGDVALRRLADAAAVRAAAAEIAATIVHARERATAEARPAAVHLDRPAGAATVVIAGDTVRRTTVADRHVTLTATRDSSAFAATGLGLGAANLSILLTRGGAAETVVVSRLGRVRW